MLRRVAPVRTDFSEELRFSFIRVTRIGELGTTLAVTSNRRTLRRNTKCNIPEDTILHSHRRENLKFYMIMPSFTHAEIRNWIGSQVYRYSILLGTYKSSDDKATRLTSLLHLHRKYAALCNLNAVCMSCDPPSNFQWYRQCLLHSVCISLHLTYCYLRISSISSLGLCLYVGPTFITGPWLGENGIV
jgi:hypothetical protein